MDTITHTMFGFVIYNSINKDNLDKKMKNALLFTSLVGSQIPDIDVVSKYFDTEGLYQMWHRGITHSIFLVPIWSLIIFILAALIWKVKDCKIFYIGLFSVFLHITSDLFNAWGTGYFEPLSSIRLSFGTIPIVDFYIWLIIISGFLIKSLKKLKYHQVFKIVLVFIMIHFISQSVQGLIIYQSEKKQYNQLALSASFIPWHFQVIGKKDEDVDISNVTVWSNPKLQYRLHSVEQANLDQLFSKDPRAKTLYEWSPFVVIVDNDQKLGIYDPRFYRNGQSFLFEYIMKTDK